MYAEPQIQSDSPVCHKQHALNDRQQRLFHLAQSARAILLQLLTLLDKTTNQDFTFESKLIPLSTLGKHYRHCIDHFEKLLVKIEDDVESEHGHDRDHAVELEGGGIVSGGPVDYDRRRRNIPVERDVVVAKGALLNLLKRLDSLTDKYSGGTSTAAESGIQSVVSSSTTLEYDQLVGLADRTVQIKVAVSPEKDVELFSSVGRELFFVTHHAIHHCAYYVHDHC